MSNTQEIHRNHSEVEEVEERAVFHYRLKRSSATKLAIWARRNGMKMYGSLELAIDLLVSTSPLIRK